jgi:predicted O-methyltransferase YrrM
MEAAVAAVLAEYESRAEREARLLRTLTREEGLRRVDEWLICVGPDTGRLLNLLVRATGARNIVEVGTAYGYSTLWLAEAARVTGGQVVSLEVHAAKQEQARASLQRAGLSGWVDLRRGDARELIPALDADIDFVLLDLWKELYVPCYELLLPKLAVGGMVVADNMLQPAEHRSDAEAYRRRVRITPGVASVLLPIGSGLELSRRESANYLAD